MILEWDDILIVGDSFCAFRDKQEHWPQYLACKLTGLEFKEGQTPRGQGFGGTAWWSVRNRLLLELEVKVPKLLILCHTDSMRIPSDFDLPLNMSSVHDSFLSKEIRKLRNPNLTHVGTAAKLYLSYLISYDFHSWSQLQWFRELDTIIQQHHISYVIHMHFPEHQNQPNGEFYKFNHGVTIEQSLWNLVSEDLVESDAPNHFTLEENIKLANCLYNIIHDYPGNTAVRLDW